MASIGAGGISPVPGGAQGDLPQWHGIYYGVVSNNADPTSKNRCLLRIPQILGSAVTTWATSLTPQQVKPAVGTMVAAMFVGGDLDYPAYYVVNPSLAVETTGSNIKPVGTSPAAGTSTKYAAADHVHGSINTTNATITVINPGTATSSAGASGELADAAHVHGMAASGISSAGGLTTVTSGTTGSGDTAATLQLGSANYAGQATIALTAAAVTMSGTLAVTGALTSQNITTSGDASFQGSQIQVGNGGTAAIILNPPQPTPVNYPNSHISTTPTSAEFNAIVDTLNAVCQYLIAIGLFA